MLGSEEKDGPPASQSFGHDWRLIPFERYSSSHDSFLAVLNNQTHNQLDYLGSDQVKAFVAQNARIFFDVYVRNATEQLCSIGTASPLEKTDFRARLTAQSATLCDDSFTATISTTSTTTTAIATTTKQAQGETVGSTGTNDMVDSDSLDSEVESGNGNPSSTLSVDNKNATTDDAGSASAILTTSSIAFFSIFPFLFLN